MQQEPEDSRHLPCASLLDTASVPGISNQITKRQKKKRFVDIG